MESKGFLPRGWTIEGECVAPSFYPLQCQLVHSPFLKFHRVHKNYSIRDILQVRRMLYSTNDVVRLE